MHRLLIKHPKKSRVLDSKTRKLIKGGVSENVKADDYTWKKATEPVDPMFGANWCPPPAEGNF